jgi:hypothetical protein
LSADNGITDLGALLRGLTPVLHPGAYVFCVLPVGAPLPDALHPVCTFHEAEGQTLIVAEAEAAAHQLEGTFRSAWITLEVHSALEAVGLMAAVSAQLARAGVACNVVSAYYHDHLFVPLEQADAALDALRALQQGANAF